jgi:membrane fusion protein, multidrug efflux system
LYSTLKYYSKSLIEYGGYLVRDTRNSIRALEILERAKRYLYREKQQKQQGRLVEWKLKAIMKVLKFDIFLWLIGTTLLIACGATGAEHEADDKKEYTIPSSPVTTKVTTAIAEHRNFQYLITSNGKIKSLHEQMITSENGGRLLQCRAKTGLFFPLGSVIARMETTPIQYKLQRARLTQFNSQKEFESQLLGYETLLKDKTKEQADAIKQKIKISTGLAGAEQEIKEANYELSKSIIRAPFSGILADVKVQQGEQLTSGQELFRIYDPNNLFLEIKILETEVALLKKGMPSLITPISTPEHKYAAEVYEINPYVDENGMVMVKLKINRLASAGNRLFPGMNCTATIQIPLEKSVIIPKEALVMRSAKAVVFSLEEGKAKWNYVIVGRDNDKEIQIKAGLKPGTKVIISNNLQLAHDAPVQEDSLHADN